jgi:hypothetical protein
VSVEKFVSICPKCRARMADKSVECVRGPAGTLLQVRVYECVRCGRMSAEELPPRSEGEAA